MNEFNIFFVSFLIGFVVYAFAYFFQVNNKYAGLFTALIIISYLVLPQKDVLSMKTVARVAGVAFTLFAFYFIFGLKL